MGVPAPSEGCPLVGLANPRCVFSISGPGGAPLRPAFPHSSWSSVTGGTGGSTYQWQWDTPGGSTAFANISGQTGSAWNPTGSSFNTTGTYRIRLNHNRTGCGCGADDSNVITFNVVAQPEITISRVGSGNICAGGDPGSFNSSIVSAGTGSNSRQWQYRVGTGGWTNVPGGTGASWNPTGTFFTTAGNWEVRNLYMVNGTGCSSSLSNVISFTVESDPSVSISTTLAGGNPVCNSNNQVAFTSSISNGTGSYSYQWQQWNGSSFVAASGTNTNTSYTTPSLAASTRYRLRITNTNSTLGCDIDFSNEIEVVIPGQPTPGGTNYTSSPSPTVSGCGSSVIAAVVGTNGDAVNFYWGGSNTSTGTQETDFSVGTETYQVTTYNTVTGCESDPLDVISDVSPSFTFTPSTTNPNCFGASNGSATISTVTGTPPYTFSWTGGGAGGSGGLPVTRTGLADGNYSVTITDASGCIATQNFTITEPDALQITSVALSASTSGGFNINCNGGTGSISPVVAGGSGSYSFSWSGPGGFSSTSQNISGAGVIAGTYTLTVNNSPAIAGCSAITETYTLTQPTPIALSVNVGYVCNASGAYTSAEVTLSGSGGVSPYTYSRNSTVTYNSTTSYTGIANGNNSTYRVRDANGCVIAVTPTISFPAAGTATDVCDFVLVSWSIIICANFCGPAANTFPLPILRRANSARALSAALLSQQSNRLKTLDRATMVGSSAPGSDRNSCFTRFCQRTGNREPEGARSNQTAAARPEQARIRAHLRCQRQAWSDGPCDLSV